MKSENYLFLASTTNHQRHHPDATAFDVFLRHSFGLKTSRALPTEDDCKVLTSRLRAHESSELAEVPEFSNRNKLF